MKQYLRNSEKAVAGKHESKMIGTRGMVKRAIVSGAADSCKKSALKGGQVSYALHLSVVPRLHYYCYKRSCGCHKVNTWFPQGKQLAF